MWARESRKQQTDDCSHSKVTHWITPLGGNLAVSDGNFILVGNPRVTESVIITRNSGPMYFSPISVCSVISCQCLQQTRCLFVICTTFVAWTFAQNGTHEDAHGVLTSNCELTPWKQTKLSRSFFFYTELFCHILEVGKLGCRKPGERQMERKKVSDKSSLYALSAGIVSSLSRMTSVSSKTCRFI